MMKRTIQALCTLAALAGVAIAADQGSGSLGAQVNGIEIGEQQPQAKSDEKLARESCLSHCNAANTRCNSEVRRAQQRCARNAASGERDPFDERTRERDPFTGRRDNYAYFCSYFYNSSRACGSDVYSNACLGRFAQHYEQCLEAMSNNVAALRHDCFRSERDAQNLCREELSDCKAACQ